MTPLAPAVLTRCLLRRASARSRFHRHPSAADRRRPSAGAHAPETRLGVLVVTVWVRGGIAAPTGCGRASPPSRTGAGAEAGNWHPNVRVCRGRGREGGCAAAIVTDSWLERMLSCPVRRRYPLRGRDGVAGTRLGLPDRSGPGEDAIVKRSKLRGEGSCTARAHRTTVAGIRSIRPRTAPSPPLRPRAGRPPMTPSDHSSGSGGLDGPAGSARVPSTRRKGGYSVLSWTLFLVAIAAVLVLLGGCLSALYGPLLTGG